MPDILHQIDKVVFGASKNASDILHQIDKVGFGASKDRKRCVCLFWPELLSVHAGRPEGDGAARILPVRLEWINH